MVAPTARQFTTAPLRSEHDRSGFSCGIAALDRYLEKQAGQDQRRGIAMPYVMCEDGQSKVLGYYTLSAFSVHIEDLPADVTRKLPKHPLLPAMLIGRLAVDEGCRGEGLGAQLLADALQRINVVSSQMGIVFVIVDAKNDDAHRFYEHFGFAACADTPGRLYLPMATVVTLFGD